MAAPAARPFTHRGKHSPPAGTVTELIGVKGGMPNERLMFELGANEMVVAPIMNACEASGAAMQMLTCAGDPPTLKLPIGVNRNIPGPTVVMNVVGANPGADATIVSVPTEPAVILKCACAEPAASVTELGTLVWAP